MTAKVYEQGGIHVRTTGRVFARCSVHWLLGVLLPFSLIQPALAIPPLVPAADVAQPDLQAWWRTGEFVVGFIDTPGRPAMRPLQNHNPTSLPKDIGSFEPLGVQCSKQPRAVAEYGGRPIEGVISGDPMNPRVQILLDNRPIAENLLGRPATVCEIRIVQADNVPGLELIVAWRLFAGTAPIHGFTVYRIPEAVDPSPRNSPE